MPTSRLAAHCYWTLFKVNNLKDAWFDSIKTIIYSCGQYHFWNNQTSFSQSPSKSLIRNQNYIIRTLQDFYTQFSIEKICLESKLYLFKNDVNTIKTSKYLLSLFERDRRDSFSNLRLGTFDIELEKGRHSGIPRDER